MLRTFPAHALGIDDDFRLTLIAASGMGNRARRLAKAIRECDAVYAATPPGMDGDAMAWDALSISHDVRDKSVCRVPLTALTADAVRAAFDDLRPLDIGQIEAHMTRRIIGRLIGWSAKLSHAEMVALRLLTEREAAIAAFVAQTGYRAAVTFAECRAEVLNASGAPLTLKDSEQARQLEVLLRHGVYWVEQPGEAMLPVPPPDALTLEQLIAAASRDLSLAPDRVVALVEMLYEAGWVTHPEAETPLSLGEAALAHIRREYGADYLSEQARVTRGIAPADVSRLPEALPGDGAALYALVWRHFIGAHMAHGRDRASGARLRVGASRTDAYPLELRARAIVTEFDGWRRVHAIPAVSGVQLALRQGDALSPVDVQITALTSQPSAPYSAARLVGALTAVGFTLCESVGAAAGLVEAGYVADGDPLTLTESGRTLSGSLTARFGLLTDPAHAAALHADLRAIAAGERDRLDLLRTFRERFDALLDLRGEG